MKTIFYTPKYCAFVTAIMLLSNLLSATEQPSTSFNIFVPPNNDNVQRNVCLVVTAIYDNTSFFIEDDGADGDTDDSKTGTLNAGQSYILYIKDNGVNDDLNYGSGGILKQDGDHFTINANKLIYATQSNNGSSQHEWVPSIDKSGIGKTFIIYTPRAGGKSRDLNVFAYENNTKVIVRKISTSLSLISGYSRVDMNSTNVVVETCLNVGQDLIYGGVEGRGLLTSGETYVIESDKPVTVQYGSLFGGQRDGLGYVLSSNGSASGKLFYFGMSYNFADDIQQEIRIVSLSNSNMISLSRYESGSWVTLKNCLADVNTILDWREEGKEGLDYPTVYRITCSPNKQVTVFENNFLETSNVTYYNTYSNYNASK
jgi:hypothetical protein